MGNGQDVVLLPRLNSFQECYTRQIDSMQHDDVLNCTLCWSFKSLLKRRISTFLVFRSYRLASSFKKPITCINMMIKRRCCCIVCRTFSAIMCICQGVTLSLMCYTRGSSWIRWHPIPYRWHVTYPELFLLQFRTISAAQSTFATTPRKTRDDKVEQWGDDRGTMCVIQSLFLALLCTTTNGHF